MNNIQKLSRNYDAIAWGAIFVWWGVLELIKLVPPGVWALGIALILLGVNFARSRNGLRVKHFSIGIGILALVWGGLEFVFSAFSLPIKLPAFEISLLVIGAFIILDALLSPKNNRSEVQND